MRMLKAVILFLAITAVLASVAGPGAAARQPISLHPENPLYFLFRGKPTRCMPCT